MAKYKSPGQKRKGIVRIISIILFIVSTYGASLIYGAVKSQSLQWVKNHHEVSASIVELVETDEEYRNLKGRKRHRTLYEVTYRFNVDGSEFTDTVEVGSSEYSSYKQGGSVMVWYDSNDPYVNDTRANIESSIAGNDSIGHMIAVAPYTVPASLFVYFLLSFIFVRESRKAMPEGFYTETSWLDIDDKYVVVLDGNELVYFDINKNQVDKLQTAYQQNASLDELVGLSKSSGVTRIPMAEISELSSNHNSDVINIEHGDKTHTIEFLNQAVKAHALERIGKLIPGSLEYRKTAKTRLQAAVPAAIFLIILLAIGYFASMFLLNLVLGFIVIVWVLPRIFSRLIDPTVTEQWLAAEASSSAN